jgi:anti-anti-sigma factor
VLDLSALTFIDAAGLRVILRAAESRNGLRPLKLVNASRVARLLEIVGLDAISTIEIVPDGDLRGR